MQAVGRLIGRCLGGRSRKALELSHQVIELWGLGGVRFLRFLGFLVFLNGYIYIYTYMNISVLFVEWMLNMRLLR